MHLYGGHAPRTVRTAIHAASHGPHTVHSGGHTYPLSYMYPLYSVRSAACMPARRIEYVQNSHMVREEEQINTQTNKQTNKVPIAPPYACMYAQHPDRIHTTSLLNAHNGIYYITHAPTHSTNRTIEIQTIQVPQCGRQVEPQHEQTKVRGRRPTKKPVKPPW